jgi:hypothetical protein
MDERIILRPYYDAPRGSTPQLGGWAWPAETVDGERVVIRHTLAHDDGLTTVFVSGDGREFIRDRTKPQKLVPLVREDEGGS